MQPLPLMMDMIVESHRYRTSLMGGRYIAVRVGFAPAGIVALLRTLGPEVRTLLSTAGWHTAVVNPDATKYAAPLMRATVRPER